MNGLEYLAMLEKQQDGTNASFSDLVRFLSLKSRDAGIPFSGHFELTPLCNFNCQMCYVHMTKEQMGNEVVLTVDQWKDLICQAWQAGMFVCTLSGGECLVYPGFEEIYLYLQNLGCGISVLTNGYLLDDRMVRFFQANKPISIQITLYGWNDDVYERVTGQRAFGRITDNIRKLQDAGINVSISITPSRYLGEDVLETLRTAYDLTKNVIINPVLTAPRKETGRTGVGDDADLDLYVRLYRLQAELEKRPTVKPFEGELPEAGGPCHECTKHGIKCGAGRSNFSIDWKGLMSFCISLDAVQFSPREEGFLNAWKKLNQAAKDWPTNAPECDGCPYKSVCINCAAYENQFAEPGKQPLMLCERTKYFVRHGVVSIPVCE